MFLHFPRILSYLCLLIIHCFHCLFFPCIAGSGNHCVVLRVRSGKKKNCGRHVNVKLNSWWRLAGAGLHVTLQQVLEGSNPQKNPGNNRSDACVQPHSMGGSSTAEKPFSFPFVPQAYAPVHNPGQLIKRNEAGNMHTFTFAEPQSQSPACSSLSKGTDSIGGQILLTPHNIRNAYVFHVT